MQYAAQPWCSTITAAWWTIRKAKCENSCSHNSPEIQPSVSTGENLMRICSFVLLVPRAGPLPAREALVPPSFDAQEVPISKKAGHGVGRGLGDPPHYMSRCP